MAGISQVFCQKLLQAYFTADVFITDDLLYVAVTASVAPANSPGSLLDEPDASAYMRSPISLSSGQWALTNVGASMYNLVDIDFPPPDTGVDWGLLNAWALCDAPTGGQVQAAGALVQPMNFTSDLPQLSIPPGGIVINLFSST